jgi:hypothetical protein
MLKKWLILLFVFPGLATYSFAKPRPADYYRNHLEEYIGETIEVPVGQLTPLNVFDGQYRMFYADTLNSKKKIDGTILVLIPKRCPGKVVNKTTYKYMVDRFLKAYPFSEISVAMHGSHLKPVSLQGKLVQFKSTIAILVENIASMEELAPPVPLEGPNTNQ